MTAVDVIDLRADATGPPSEDEAPTPDDGSGGFAWLTRRRIVVTLLAVLALVVLDLVLGAAVHAEHQRHLAAEFAEPKDVDDLEVGDASYVMQIPSLGLNEVVVEGASADELRGGPGRRLDSMVPGEDGNTVIQGTSTRFGGSLGSLDDVVAGKSIFLRSRAEEVFKYKVTKVRTVKDGDNGYLEAAGPDRLTIVTSAQGPLSGSRLVVTAIPDADASEEAMAEAAASDDGGDPVKEPPTGPEQVFDVRGAGTAVLLLCGIGLLVVGLAGASGLRRRYRASTVAVVAGSSVALGVVLILFNVAALLPTTF